MEELLREILTEVKSIKNDVVYMQQDIGTLKEGQANTDNHMEDYAATQAKFDNRMDNLEAGQVQLGDRMDNLAAGQAQLGRRMDIVEIRLENEAFDPLRLLSESITHNNEAINFLVNTVDFIANKIDYVSTETGILAERVSRLEKAAK